MRPGATSVVIAIAFACIALSVDAQSPDPSWRAAEALVRTHFAGVAGETLLEVRPRRDLHLGPVFWARRSVEGGTFRGNLVFVRGTDVLYGQGEADLMRILRADDAVHRARWTAAALLAVMTEMQVTTPLPEAPITTHEVRALLPRIERSGDVLTFTLFAHHGGPPEAPATPQWWVTRAVMTLGNDYVPHWTTTDLVVDRRGRELRH